MRAITSKLKPENPRLLVLGGSGRLGGLLRRVWDRPGAMAPRIVWQARRADDFAELGGPSVVFDPLADPAALQAAVQAADAVLLLAGPTRGSAETLSLNARLALAVLAVAGGRPVLIASSAAVYGLPGAGPCREEDPPAPLSDYGRAKAAMEEAVRGLPGAMVLRIGNVAGADALLGTAAPAGGRVLHLFDTGAAPRRSYIGPQALARALARLVRLAVAGAELPALLNLALPGVVGMEALLQAAGQGFRTEAAPAGAIATVELDVTRALRLGLVPDLPATAAQILADLRMQETAA